MLQLNERREEYPPAMQYALQNLMDSHDTDRLASMIVNAGRRPYSQPEPVRLRHRRLAALRADLRRAEAERSRAASQRLVALLQMTYVGAPMIYYGTEAGMWGADDPCDRMPMVWAELTYEPQRRDPLGRQRQADPVAFDEGLFNFYRAAIELRTRTPALRRGDISLSRPMTRRSFWVFVVATRRKRCSWA